MPTRILRDGILSSRHVAALSDSAEILYRRLMSVVDDYGRFEADIDLIRARCFPLQLETWKNPRILKALAELSASPLVTVYYGGGKQLLQINNFGQRTQSKPKFPAPEDCVDSKGLPFSTVDHGDSRESTVENRESREITVQSESESESKTESYAETGGGTKQPRRFTITSLPDEYHAYAKKKFGWSIERSTWQFEKFKNHWGSKGEARVNWLLSWHTWVMNDEERNPSKASEPYVPSLPRNRSIFEVAAE